MAGTFVRRIAGSARRLVALAGLLAVAPALAVAQHALLIGAVERTTTVGRPVVLEFDVAAEDAESVTIALPDALDPLAIVASGVTPRVGRRVTLRVEVAGAIAGRHIIEQIEISSDTGSTVIPAILISVTERDGTIPFVARWRIDATTITVGRSIPILLEIDRVDDFVFPQVIDVRAPATALLEEVSGVGSVVTRRVGETTLYRIPVAGYILTPTAPGALTLPPATVRAIGIEALTLPVSITVAPLPAAVQPTGAVGALELEASIDRFAVAPGDEVRIRLEVRGAGNIRLFQFPDVTAASFVETDRRETVDVAVDTETGLGWRGSRVLEVTLAADERLADTEGESATIEVAPFTVFDPRSSTVRPGQPIRFPVTITATPGAVRETARVEPPELLPIRSLRSIRWTRFLDRAGLFGLAAIGPVIAFALRVTAPRPRRDRSGRGGRRPLGFLLVVGALLGGAAWPPSIDVVRLARAAELAGEGRPAVAAALYDLELRDHPDHPALHANRAILAMEVGDGVAAVFHARRAVQLAPLYAPFRDLLDLVALQFPRGPQPSIDRYLRPEVLFVIALLFWTVGWVGFGASGRRRGWPLIAFVLLPIIVAALPWSVGRAQRPDGTVLRETTMRRIPDPDATAWVILSPADAVLVELEYEGFYLVRTGADITGWVPRRALWLDGE